MVGIQELTKEAQKVRSPGLAIYNIWRLGMKTIKGKAYGYFETGTEGTIWSLQQDMPLSKEGFMSHEAFIYLKPRDLITLSIKDRVIFSGYVEYAYSWSLPANMAHYYKKYYEGSKHGQICLGGFWVHSLPLNVDLAHWYQAFFDNEDGRYQIVMGREE